MAHKLYLVLSGLIFFLVSVLHLFRLVYHWPIVVGPWTIPYALSYVGCPGCTRVFGLGRLAARPSGEASAGRVTSIANSE